MTHSWILKLFSQYCKNECHELVERCQVVQAINAFNAKYPSQKISWCPVCNGLFVGWKEIGTKQIPVYEGGILIGAGIGDKRKNYRFAYACIADGCLAGEEEQKRLNTYPHDPFITNNCFRTLSSHRLEEDNAKVKANPRPGNVGDYLPPIVNIHDPAIEKKKQEALKRYQSMLTAGIKADDDNPLED